VWKWCRHLLAYEEEQVEKCNTLSHKIVLQVEVSDSWQWNIHSSKWYRVSLAYHYLPALENVTTQDSSYIIWHKEVPLKTSLFHWRLLHNWIPTIVNLLRRGLFQNLQQLCMGECGSNEDLNHLFLQCYFLKSTFILFSQWSGYVTMIPTLILDHLHQFGHLGG